MARSRYPRRARKSKKTKRSKKSLSYPDARNAKTQGMYTTLQAGLTTDGTKPAFTSTGILITATGAIAGNVGQVAGSFNFQIAQCPAWNSLSSGWDRYRVNKVHVKIIPTITQAIASVSQGVPVMRVVKDYDDNFVTVQNAGGAAGRSLYPMDIWARRGKEFRLNSNRTISFVPKIAAPAMSASAGATSVVYNATSVKCPWLNVTQSLVQLYGLKWAVKNFPFQTGTPVVPNLVQFEVTFDVSFSQQQYLTTGAFPSMTEMGMPIGNPVPCYYYTPSGVYDASDNLLAAPDADGNEIPVV